MDPEIKGALQWARKRPKTIDSDSIKIKPEPSLIILSFFGGNWPAKALTAKQISYIITEAIHCGVHVSSRRYLPGEF
jgi:hypothetical protein